MCNRLPKGLCQNGHKAAHRQAKHYRFHYQYNLAPPYQRPLALYAQRYLNSIAPIVALIPADLARFNDYGIFAICRRTLVNVHPFVCQCLVSVLLITGRHIVDVTALIRALPR